ncbi:MAG: hypothetical protein HY057_05940 [Rhodospirillales bacterium]|nr:hypothetical protein [Rhodospirillales bacterium]
MTRRGARDPRQRAMFDADDARHVERGAFDFDLELRGALSDAIAGSGKRRDQIAAEMERLLGGDPDYPVSRALIDAWTAPSRTGHRFPALYLPVFIEVTGAGWLLDRLARKCGRIVIAGEQARHVERGEVEAEIERLQARRRQLRKSGGAP